MVSNAHGEFWSVVAGVLAVLSTGDHEYHQQLWGTVSSHASPSCFVLFFFLVLGRGGHTCASVPAKKQKKTSGSRTKKKKWCQRPTQSISENALRFCSLAGRRHVRCFLFQIIFSFDNNVGGARKRKASTRRLFSLVFSFLTHFLVEAATHARSYLLGCALALEVGVFLYFVFPGDSGAEVIVWGNFSQVSSLRDSFISGMPHFREISLRCPSFWGNFSQEGIPPFGVIFLKKVFLPLG